MLDNRDTTELADSLRLAAAEMARGDLTAAAARYEAVLALEGSADAHLGLAIVSLCESRLDDHRQHLRAAYGLFRESGRPARAAWVACLLAFDESATGNLNVGRGWLDRAARLLDGLDLCSEHGWHAIWRAWLEGDPNGIEAAAEHGTSIARRFGDTELEVLSNALRGGALVNLGRVGDGMALLDGAMASVLAGEVGQPVVLFDCICILLAACEQAGDYGRAEEWCRVALEVARSRSISYIATSCRTTYGGILGVLGRCAEAEAELDLAIGAATSQVRLDALAQLADLRRRQGRLKEAARLLEEASGSPAAARVAAELALDSGDAARARRLADVLLSRAGASLTHRAIALHLAARAATIAGDLERTAATVIELERAVTVIGTAQMIAGLWSARGGLALARGRHREAATDYWEAAQLYTGVGAVHEAAHARLRLAAALRADGCSQEAAAEERLARQALLALAGEPATPLSPRELEVLRELAAGRTNAETAARLGLSAHTVHRHVANVFVKLNVPSRAAAVAEASRLGLI